MSLRAMATSDSKETSTEVIPNLLAELPMTSRSQLSQNDLEKRGTEPPEQQNSRAQAELQVIIETE